MPFQERRDLIEELENLRGSKVICYLTSVRSGAPAQMAEDQVRVIFDHLLRLPAKPVEKLDIFLCSNGGNGTVPWRLVALFREYSNSFNVIIPYRAYSAASLLALGADEIVMHPFAELGPIDPTVSNEFNPVEQGRPLGISVEDVRAYVSFIKNTVGITHEDELVRAIEILAQKVHPLALGNVERFVSQSRMIAKKILKTHMKDEADNHKIEEIVENMASKLYFHGHPINRHEAKNDLRLKVNLNLQPALESLIWNLYADFEAELHDTDVFNPIMNLSNAFDPAAPPAMGTPILYETEIIHAVIESGALSSQHVTRRRFARYNIPIVPGISPQQAQPIIQEEILSQGWNHSEAPAA